MKKNYKRILEWWFIFIISSSIASEAPDEETTTSEETDLDVVRFSEFYRFLDLSYVEVYNGLLVDALLDGWSILIEHEDETYYEISIVNITLQPNHYLVIHNDESVINSSIANAFWLSYDENFFEHNSSCILLLDNHKDIISTFSIGSSHEGSCADSPFVTGYEEIESNTQSINVNEYGKVRICEYSPGREPLKYCFTKLPTITYSVIISFVAISFMSLIVIILIGKWCLTHLWEVCGWGLVDEEYPMNGLG
eukprot:TRINITY_DN669_c0_g1_i1.p1 TRINITY_DN669_c0_g1~~TRINITY_DN669_c0_g1_i1.p1  ORF type:complete len:252 (-),score=33.15 TRINITY_DN669_c0_g1_i1:66-821(-)